MNESVFFTTRKCGLALSYLVLYIASFSILILCACSSQGSARRRVAEIENRNEEKTEHYGHKKDFEIVVEPVRDLAKSGAYYLFPVTYDDTNYIAVTITFSGRQNNQATKWERTCFVADIDALFVWLSDLAEVDSFWIFVSSDNLDIYGDQISECRDSNTWTVFLNSLEELQKSEAVEVFYPSSPIGP